MSGALEGLRVVELCQVMAGPFCGQVLADMGADVIKVEPPDGDQTRDWLEGAAFRAVNRNKRGIVLDLKQADDRATLHALVGRADVLLESFRPGVAARLGAGYEELAALNPRLVYASISGFGQTGPYAQRPGFDLIAQGVSGIMSVTGEPGGEPVKCGVPVSDLSAGLFCAIGVLSALAARERTGAGQWVDTSLWEGALALSVWETAELWATGEVPQPHGSAHRLAAPYQALRTRDGHITVGGNSERLWERLCAAIDRPELASDARFATNADRMAHRPALAAELETALATRDTADWVERLLEAGVPAGPILDYAQAVADPHTRAREMVVDTMLGIPVKLSATPGSIRRVAPRLGEHTDEILAELRGPV